jgi:hypothetical protein
MDRGKILTTAKDLTCNNRQKTYGSPGVQLGLTAELFRLWKYHAGTKYSGAHDEAIRMVLAKLSRIACGQPGHLDNYVDAAAYVAIAGEIVTSGKDSA